jgi:hypothetical protein
MIGTAQKTFPNHLKNGRNWGVDELMRTLKIKLGVDRKARQKKGVSIELFQLLLTKVNKLRIVDAVRKGLYLRDQEAKIVLLGNQL